MRRTALLALVLALAPAAARAAPAADAEPGEFEFRVAAGRAEEICLRLERGQGIEFRFRADAPVDFDIHYHVGRRVVTPFAAPGVERQVNRFVAKARHTYCMMWTVRGSADAGVLGRWHRLPAGAR